MGLRRGCRIVSMMAYPLRRAYFGIVGVLLFTLLLFFVLPPIPSPFAPSCHVIDGVRTCTQADPDLDAIHAEGYSSLDEWWADRQPRTDYWPLVLALLGTGAAIDALLHVRSRRRPGSMLP